MAGSKTHNNIKKHDIRISVPTINISKFQNILLYIIEQCAGKPNVGETVLNKLLYFCDFNYYEIYEEHLTGANYIKLQHGPVPQAMKDVIDDLKANNKIMEYKTVYHNLPQTRYINLETADMTKLMAAEKDIIDKVVAQMSSWNAISISEYSHRDIPWLATSFNDEIDYNLVFYREPPYTMRIYEDE
jgi:uncharacterized phage-associated protein